MTICQHPKFEDIKIRFWSKVNKNSGVFGIDGTFLTECWIWTAGKYKNQYGIFTVDGKHIKAHRACWEIWYGIIPNDQYVLHKCDLRYCVRPDHLFLGTYQDNLQDMMAKGRGKGQLKPGEENLHAKLTKEQVLEIRNLYASTKSFPLKYRIKQKQLAQKFNVTPQMISDIVGYKNWKHV